MSLLGQHTGLIPAVLQSLNKVFTYLLITHVGVFKVLERDLYHLSNIGIKVSYYYYYLLIKARSH